MLQLNLVVEILIIGVLATVPIVLVGLGFKANLLTDLRVLFEVDPGGLKLLTLAAGCYLLGILANAGIYRFLTYKFWPVRSWYSRFRQFHFNDPYFSAVNEKTRCIPDDLLVERTIIYVGMRNQVFLQTYEFFRSIMRLARAGAAISLVTALIAIILIFRFPHDQLRILLGSLISLVISWFCWQTFKGIEIDQYRRLLSAFGICKNNEEPHAVFRTGAEKQN